jgi:hypothetical protein
VASHVGFMAEGRLLLAASIEELRKRIVRVRLRFEGPMPDPTELGTVLEFECSGRRWQAVLQDPDRVALEELGQYESILDLEETPLNLEEMYTALLARFHRPDEEEPSSNGQSEPPDRVTPPSGVERRHRPPSPIPSPPSGARGEGEGGEWPNEEEVP